jgi:hypothetical protein
MMSDCAYLVVYGFHYYQLRVYPTLVRARTILISFNFSQIYHFFYLLKNISYYDLLVGGLAFNTHESMLGSMFYYKLTTIEFVMALAGGLALCNLFI